MPFKDRTKVYVTNSDNNNVSVFNTTAKTVSTTVNVGFWPNGVAVDPTGTKIYVANDGSSTVSIIDTTTNDVKVIVNGLNYSYGVAVNPTGTKVYVANSGNNSVSVIDTATNTVTATLPLGDNPMAFGQFISKINGFYDIESSPNNNFTAGTLSLSLLHVPCTTNITFPQGIKPGDSCYTTETIKNVGSLAGNLSMSFQNLTETDMTTKFYPNGNPSGALGKDVQMALWIDTMNHGHNFITGDILLQAGGTFTNTTPSLTYYAPSIYNNSQWM
jgi:YVTN family beta-propeller protein